ncbi:MAG: hypothetical protein HOB20_00345, partial [Planctomycetaceae bacterium]|nr:hypothetical protein [Planctomycetaceae bacterium]
MSITMIMLFSNPLLLAQASTDNTTVLQVKHNQAPALATRLESVLKDFGVSAQVTANRANNTLIVNGSSNAHKIAADLLRTLDKPATSQPAQVTKQSTSKVVGYNVPTDMLAETAQKIQAAFANQKEVKVVPDARTGQVVVIAGDLVHQQIAQYLASISNSARTAVQPVSGTAKPVHQLKSIGWKEFEASIQSMMGGKLNLSTNPTGEVASLAVPSRSGSGALLQVNRRTNTITIEGDAVARQAWLKITRLLDQPTTGKEERTGIVPVEKASPNTVNKAVALVENAEKAAGNDKGALRRTQNGKAWGGDLVSSIFNQDAVAQEDTVAQEGAPTADDSDDEIGETLLQIEPGEAGLIG